MGGCRWWEDSDVVWAIRSFVPKLVQCIKMPLLCCKAAHTQNSLTFNCLAYISLGFLSNTFM